MSKTREELNQYLTEIQRGAGGGDYFANLEARGKAWREVLAEFDRLTEEVKRLTLQEQALIENIEQTEPQFGEVVRERNETQQALERICEPLKRDYNRRFYLHVAKHSHSVNVIEALERICDYLDSQQKPRPAVQYLCTKCGEGLSGSCLEDIVEAHDCKPLCRKCNGKGFIKGACAEFPYITKIDCPECKPKEEERLREILHDYASGIPYEDSERKAIADILKEFKLRGELGRGHQRA